MSSEAQKRGVKIKEVMASISDQEFIRWLEDSHYAGMD